MPPSEQEPFPDEPGEDASGRWLLAGLVAGLMLIPGVLIAVSVLSTEGGGALDAVGMVVMYAAIPASLFAAIAGGVATRAPRRSGAGLLLGLLVGSLTWAGTAVLAFLSFLGGV